MATPILIIKSLKVSFRRAGKLVPVVHDLNATVSAGKTLAIVGESGSGKSVSSLSILQLLNKEVSSVSGEVLFTQVDGTVDALTLDKAGLNELRGGGIAMIFQEPMAALNPVLKCGVQVAEMINAHQTGLSKAEVSAQVLDLFNEVELPRPEAMMDSYPHQLSGGQQQRVMIAMALANKPLLLIADEPTTALDPQVQDGIIELLKKLQRKTGMAIIFISHDLDAVEKIADDIIVMQNGACIEQGTAAQVLRSPQHPYTKGLLNCKPGKDKKGLRLPTVKNYLEDPSFQPVKNPAKKIGPETILEARDISVVYTSGGLFKRKTEVAAISNVDIQLLKGETVGIIGPSGCGKTTLGRVIAGWVKPTSGEVLLNGATYISPELKPGKDWAREVQLIFQDPFGSLNPKIKIGLAIAEPMLVHGLVADKVEARIQTEWLLEKVGLQKEHFDRYPHEFSGGQRQRIVVARALAVKPKVLICDESVAALDVSVQAQVLNLLNDLQRELGLSYLFISHDHNVIAYFCDRIIEMEMGKVKQTSVNVVSAKSEVTQTVEAPTAPVETIIKEETKEEVLVSAPLADELLADEVSANLLKLRLEQEHRKMEKLAETLHIPVVSEESEVVLEEEEPLAEIASEPEKPVEIIKEKVPEVIPTPEAEKVEEIEEEIIPEVIEEVISVQPEVENIEQTTPSDTKKITEEKSSEQAVDPKKYRSLGDFIKNNKS